MTDQKETEQQILDAARREFQQNGYAGARMQAIADEAGINKSMLHYYYRSKDHLFQQVFRESVRRFFPVIFNVLNSDLPLAPKVKKLIDTYHEIFLDNPQLPQFVLHEMNQHPDRFKKFMKSQGVSIPQKFVDQVQEEIRAGRMRPVQPHEFIINTIALCVFPYIARNMIEVIFGMDEQDFRNFIEKRKENLPGFILKDDNP